MLRFDHRKFDFWPIYNAIVHFYPIAIKKDESNLFFDHAGYKELRKIIEEEIHHNQKFEHWDNFSKQIATETNKLVVGTTYGQAPSFSSYMELEKTTLDNLTRTKELHFYVSLLGPYYTVFGQDRNTVAVENHRNIYSTNYFVTSPEKEFAEGFKMLCEKIENHFKGFRFVPAYIYQQKIENLFISYSSENSGGTVFHALFNNTIDFDNAHSIGNVFYESEKWIKEGYVDTGGLGWTSYPPEGRLRD